jgi:hypothetical protein
VKCKDYEVQIRTVCPFDTTSYDSVYILKTECDVAVEDPFNLLTSFEVYPNPAVDVAYAKLTSVESGRYNVSIVSLQGQRLEYRTIDAVANQPSTIEFSNVVYYPPGLYFIVVEKDGKRTTRKLVHL